MTSPAEFLKHLDAKAQRGTYTATASVAAELIRSQHTKGVSDERARVVALLRERAVELDKCCTSPEWAGQAEELRRMADVIEWSEPV